MIFDTDDTIMKYPAINRSDVIKNTMNLGYLTDIQGVSLERECPLLNYDNSTNSIRLYLISFLKISNLDLILFRHTDILYIEGGPNYDR